MRWLAALVVATTRRISKEFRTRASDAHPFRCSVNSSRLSKCRGLRERVVQEVPKQTRVGHVQLRHGWGALVWSLESSAQSLDCSAHLRLKLLAQWSKDSTKRAFMMLLLWLPRSHIEPRGWDGLDPAGATRPGVRYSTGTVSSPALEMRTIGTW